MVTSQHCTKYCSMRILTVELNIAGLNCECNVLSDSSPILLMHLVEIIIQNLSVYFVAHIGWLLKDKR